MLPIDWFASLNPVLQALGATLFTWLLTALGAALIFFFKTINRQVLDGMLGVAAGVMIYVVAEELIPSARQENHSDFATVGVMLGFAIMMSLDVGLG